MRTKRVLVTGAGGFVGRFLVKELSRSGIGTTALFRGPARTARLQLPNVELVKCDLRDHQTLDRAMTGCDTVFNLAYDMRASVAENLDAFESLLSAVKSAGIRRMVHLSSIVVYDDWLAGSIIEQSPATPEANSYRGAKIEMEQRLARLTEQAGIETICLQPTLIYGPGSYLWTDLPVERLVAGKVVLPDAPGDCHAVYVGDVVQAAISAANASLDRASRCILSGPEPVSWREFYQSYAGLLGQGEVELRPLEEFTSPADADSPHSPTALPAGPSTAARVSAVLRRIIGKDGVDRLRRAAMKLKRLRGPSVYQPSAEELPLFLAWGDVSTQAARDLLGFRPEFSFSRGIAATAPYLKARYGENQTGI